MSTKSMPFIGKSGKLRREAWRVFLTRASSEVLEALVVDWDWSRVRASSSWDEVVGTAAGAEVWWTVIVKKRRGNGGRGCEVSIWMVRYVVTAGLQR